MRIEIFADSDNASRRAADRLTKVWRRKNDLVLGAATGDSPTLTYRYFVEAVRSEGANKSLPRLLKLDEWGGLAMDDPATCESYLQKHLIRPLNLPTDRCVGFRSFTEAPAAECQRIANWIQANGPIDVCILGLGRNGHLAMNEPGADPQANCHVAMLTESTLAHPMLGPARARPAHGLTIGLAEILASREIILLVFGRAKAGPLARLFSARIEREFPASHLWRHKNVCCLADTAAVSAISPDWLEQLGAEICLSQTPKHHEKAHLQNPS